MRYHYRAGGEWRPEFIEMGEELAGRLRKAASGIGPEEAAGLPTGPMLREVRAALDDNLNAPACVQMLDSWLGKPVAAEWIGDAIRVAHLLGIETVLAG